MKPVNEVKMEFLSRSSNEGFARAAAACFAAQMDPTLEEVGDIKTAVSEGVTNAIVHAYPNEIGKVMVRMRIYQEHVLEIVIRDWGVGIPDIEQAREPMYTTGGCPGANDLGTEGSAGRRPGGGSGGLPGDHPHQ